MAPHSRPTIDTPRAEALREVVRESLERGRTHLLSLQRRDGHWVGELEGDTILESEYVLLLAYLGKETDPQIPKLAKYLLRKQLPDGGWPNYPGGPAEVSVSAKAYFALKIAGHTADEPLMRRAAECIRHLGGAAVANSFTRFYFALLGQIPYANCPTVPVEMMLLPRWFYFNIYAMSAWSRTIVVPLAVVNAYKPVRELPPSMGIRELFLADPATPWKPAVKPARFSWANLFLKIDAGLKLIERCHLTPFRRMAMRKAIAWMRERFQNSDGLGAIYPPMVFTVIVLKCLGIREDDAEFRWAMKQLEDLGIDDGETLRLQPCLSPVWDTAITTIALTESGLPPVHNAIRQAEKWLLSKEVRHLAALTKAETPGDKVAVWSGWAGDVYADAMPSEPGQAIERLGEAASATLGIVRAGLIMVEADTQRQRWPELGREGQQRGLVVAHRLHRVGQHHRPQAAGEDIAQHRRQVAV